MVVRMASDGDCLFHALGYGTHQSAHQVRARIVRHMAAHWHTSYEPFVPEAHRQGYLARMQRSGTWGGELELRAHAHASRECVLVHDTSRRVIARYGSRRDPARHLLYSDSHYDVIVPTS